MRRPLVPTAALVAFALWVTILAPTLIQDAALGQEGTPSHAGTAMASPAASPAACPEDAPPGRLVNVPNKVTIHLTDEGFEPARIQMTNNVDLTITLVNSGTRSHAFVVDDFDIAVELAPGESEEITVTPTGDDAASHDFYSDAPGDECMRGAIIFYI